MTTRQLVLSIGVGIVCIIVIVAYTERGTAEPPPLPTAGPFEQAAFAGLVRTEQHILHNAIVSGDPSLYPTVYYNDPTVMVDGESSPRDWRRLAMNMANSA